MAAVDLKLRGVHPCYILISEFGVMRRDARMPVNNSHVKEVVTRLFSGNAVMKVGRDNLISTRRFLPYVLDVKSQVDCLVRMAVEPAILMRQYHGWRAYL